MSESSEVVGGGTSALVAAALDASAVSAPIEEGGGGTTPEDTSRTRRANFQVSSPLPKEGGTYGSNNMNRLTSREIN